jgi:hypothetical protein
MALGNSVAGIESNRLLLAENPTFAAIKLTDRSWHIAAN